MISIQLKYLKHTHTHTHVGGTEQSIIKKRNQSVTINLKNIYINQRYQKYHLTRIRAKKMMHVMYDLGNDLGDGVFA